VFTSNKIHNTHSRKNVVHVLIAIMIYSNVLVQGRRFIDFLVMTAVSISDLKIVIFCKFVKILYKNEFV
jgi:hypothetical protein